MSPNASIKLVNALCSGAMLVLLAFHGLGNAFQLFGAGSPVPALLSWSMLFLAALHFAIGLMLTFVTLQEQKRTGRAYWGLNKRFWAVRLSGLAIALLVVCHLLIFARFGTGPVRLAFFGPAELAASLLLVAALLVHVLANVQPLLISLGVGAPRGRAVDIAIVLGVLLLVSALAFVVYFLRWSVV